MPLLGWLLGDQLGPLVAQWDHWIAVVLLCGIGFKMLLDARKLDLDSGDGATPPQTEAQLFAPRVMLLLAVATSIDAFAVGVTLPMLHAPLLLSLVTIGVVTALLSALGIYAGRRFGAMLGRGLDAFGGVVLIALGIKILLEHLS
jgi:manganese efflux pump family protein